MARNDDMLAMLASVRAGWKAIHLDELDDLLRGRGEELTFHLTAPQDPTNLPYHPLDVLGDDAMTKFRALLDEPGRIPQNALNAIVPIIKEAAAEELASLEEAGESVKSLAPCEIFDELFYLDAKTWRKLLSVLVIEIGAHPLPEPPGEELPTETWKLEWDHIKREYLAHLDELELSLKRNGTARELHPKEMTAQEPRGEPEAPVAAPPEMAGDAGPRDDAAGHFAFKPGQVFYDERELDLPVGFTTDVLRKLVGKVGSVVSFKELYSYNPACSADEKLKSAISEIRKALKAESVPFKVISKRTIGYILA
jgi:hypothetical protein